MSEKIYAWLLRLFPSHFRKTYGHAALQLFRDRFRDERGFVPRIRLWLDLLFDLAISLPREHRRVPSALVAASAQHRSDGIPAFHILEDEQPRPGAFLFGGVLSLVALGTISVLMSHVGNYRPLRGSVAQPQYPAHARSPALSRPAAQAAADAQEGTTASGPPAKAAGSLERGAIEGVKVGAAEREHVLDRVIADLRQYYFDRNVAQRTANALLAHEKSGDDNAATEGGAFAKLLTRQMRDASHNTELIMVYSQDKLPERPPAQTSEDLARYRKFVELNNCFFKKIEILPHNIGYLKLDWFSDPFICRPTAVAAMASLNNASAIIFDLRDNHGGAPGSTRLIASYLFDHPEYWYSPREAPTEDSWTRSPVPGNKLADKPVYVLTSASTLSGAEQFCYNLKMLKRATLVGETTRGGAHAGVFHRIDDHFGVGIPEAKSINPFGKADWEGTGVEPDVKVKADEALQAAVKLAERKLQKK